MKLKFAALVFGTLFLATPASAAGVGGGCDTQPGRDGGQAMCDSGLTCTGPFEGMYGRGNCQAGNSGAGRGEGCDTQPGRSGGQAMCSAGLSCTGPFEGMYGRGNCQ